MSRWAPEPRDAEAGKARFERDKDAPAGSASAAKEPAQAGPSPGVLIGRTLPLPGWVRVVPFVLSAFLFLSGVFAVFAPLPILLLAMRSRRRWAWFAALTNAAMVDAAGGWVSLAFYSVFVLSLALAMPEFLRRRWSLEKTAGFTLLTMVATGAAIVLAYSLVRQVNPVIELRALVSQGVDTLAQSLSSETRSNWLGGTEPDEWKRNFLIELPSALGVLSLVLVWANLVILLRLNPNGLRERLGLDPGFFRKWKAPELLLWPTIACGFLLVWDTGWPSHIALNAFKFFMAIYAIQGLSILSFLFDVWNVGGKLRTVGFALAIFLMMPLVLSIGFFDLWFDFRAKLRQS
jgi:hypothetical protein